VASSKKKAVKKKASSWAEFSASVTALDEKQSLKALRNEAQREGGARPYVMKRYYHRWRQATGPSDRAAIEMGKLPDYLR